MGYSVLFSSLFSPLKKVFNTFEYFTVWCTEWCVGYFSLGQCSVNNIVPGMMAYWGDCLTGIISEGRYHTSIYDGNYEHKFAQSA